MIWLASLRKWLPEVIVAACVLLVLVGWHMMVESWKAEAYAAGYSKAKAEGDLALEQLRGEHRQQELERALAAAADAKSAAKRLQEEQARNNQLAADLAELQRKHRQTTDRLTGEIARVNDLYRRALDAAPEPLPACVFTRGWVRVYDQATGAAPMPPAKTATGAAAPGAEAAALEQLDSGLSQRAVLAHHVRYAEQCRNTSAQLDALINALGDQ